MKYKICNFELNSEKIYDFGWIKNDIFDDVFVVSQTVSAVPVSLRRWSHFVLQPITLEILFRSAPNLTISLLVRPKTIVFGRTYVLRMMFFFPSMRSPRCVGRPAWNFARWSVQLLGATPLLKFGRAKNVPSLVRFTTTFEFDREYLWNQWR